MFLPPMLPRLPQMNSAAKAIHPNTLSSGTGSTQKILIASSEQSNLTFPGYSFIYITKLSKTLSSITAHESSEPYSAFVQHTQPETNPDLHDLATTARRPKSKPKRDFQSANQNLIRRRNREGSIRIFTVSRPVSAKSVFSSARPVDRSSQRPDPLFQTPSRTSELSSPGGEVPCLLRNTVTPSRSCSLSYCRTFPST
ncbi:hypothetical protein Mapa_010710 [Marchantia paleacea]|nr:hypothetical protein Mapa_010710 [Marchantia paleacea]